MKKKSRQVKFNNYVVVDTNPNDNSVLVSKFEKDLITKYLNKNLSEFKDDCEIEKISSNFFYESYSILIDNKKFLLKISLDPDNRKLTTEYNSLNSIADRISTKIISYENDKKNGIELLLTTWENGESFKEFGIEDLVYNLGTFCNVLAEVNESKNEKAISFLDLFLLNESVVPLFNSINPKEVLIFEKLVDLTLDDLDKIFLKIKKDYLDKYEEKITVLSHSNLQLSNILYNSGYIKFINFENSHNCDIYYSLLQVVNNLGLYFNEKKVTKFLTIYHSASTILKEVTLDEFLNTYEERKKFNEILMFHDLLHKILFHFVAYGAFYKSSYLIRYMDLYLTLKPSVKELFPEYIKSFDKLFFTVMPTVKTYDIKELEKIRDSDSNQ